MSKSYCPFCGSDVEANNQFCPNCGASMTAVKTPSPQPEQPYPTTQPYPTAQPYTQQTTTYVTAQRPQQDSLGTLSLVFAILSFFCLGTIGSIVAIICGHIAKSRGSNGSATAGLIIGYIGLVLSVVGIVIYIILFSTQEWVFY
ncbi:MAG: DUF4190 domain-containing protein [Candidatus Heimdallarchaeota archaeon]|nr:DUF4190 domain-containing protein [Candidatus Heimdallarchaeota archaeon]